MIRKAIQFFCSLFNPSPGQAEPEAVKCPKCGSSKIKPLGLVSHECDDCGEIFKVRNFNMFGG